jgi:hypothetical protein
MGHLDANEVFSRPPRSGWKRSIFPMRPAPTMKSVEIIEEDSGILK